jgi:hypothetical protein
MLVFQGTAQSAGDKQIIARLAASARYAAVSFNKTNHTNRNRHGSGCAAHFAPNYADFKSLRGPAQSTIKPLHPFDLCFLGSDESDECRLRHGRRCSEIAERTHHRFPADVERVCRRQEVHARDNAIGLKYKKVLMIAGFHHGAIITGTIEDFLSERETRKKLSKQPIFADVAQFHCGVIPGTRVDLSADWRLALPGRVMEKRSPEMQER